MRIRWINQWIIYLDWLRDITNWILILDFYTSSNFCFFFSRSWLTANFLRYLGPFKAFWLILTVLKSEWSRFSSSHRPFSKPLRIVLSSPTALFHSFLVLRQGLSICLSFRFLCTAGTAKSSKRLVFFLFLLCFFFSFLFILLIITRSCLLARIRWFVCISKSQRISCIFKMDSSLCIYHSVIWSLTQFPVNYFSHLVVPRLVLLCS